MSKTTRTKLVPPAILGLLLTIGITASVVFAQPGGSSNDQAARFEYKVVHALSVVEADAFSNREKAAAELQTKFNEYGEDGWELCQEMDGILTFKRQK